MTEELLNAIDIVENLRAQGFPCDIDILDNRIRMRPEIAAVLLAVVLEYRAIKKQEKNDA